MTLHWLQAGAIPEPHPAPSPIVEAALEGADPVEDGEDTAGAPLWYAGTRATPDAAPSLLWVARGTTNDDGTTSFVASTASVDRMGDVIDQGTWRLGAYRQNPVVCYQHGSLVVGRGKVQIRTAADGTKYLGIDVTWDEDPINPTGQLCAHQHRDGFRSAVSVGLLPGKYVNRTDLPQDHPYWVDGTDTPRWRAGYFYSQCELLEVSSVAVPANREAIQLSLLARQAAGPDEDPLEVAHRLVRTASAVGREELEALVRSIVDKAVPTSMRSALRDDAQIRALVASVTLGRREAEPENPTPTREKSTGPSGPTWTRRS